MKIYLWPGLLLIFFLIASPIFTSENDGHPYYQLTFSEGDLSKVKVYAKLSLADNTLKMAPWGHPNLTHGWATFVHHLKVTDKAGKPVKLTPIEKDGWGSWQVDAANGEALELSYEVHFDHDQYDWNAAGGQDSRPAESNGALFLVTKALFIYSPNVADATIELKVPDNWTISSPWPRVETGSQTYFADSWISLVNNSLVVGDHFRRMITDDNMLIILAIDNALTNSVDLFEETFRKLLAGFRQVFKGSPKTRYLVTLREANEDDGESFENSFNQVMTNQRIDQRQIIWANTMGHELFHYWNGNHVLVGKEKSTVEWFGEGFTEYYASLTLRRIGLIDESLYFKKLERYFARYFISKKMWPLDPVSLVDAGKEKLKNWLLIYGGGATVALALDLNIRSTTAGRKSLDDVMLLLKQRFGEKGKRYTVPDLLSAVSDVAGHDFSQFFNDYILGKDAFLDIGAVLKLAGLELQQFSDEFYISKMPEPSKLQQVVFDGLMMN